MTMFTQLTVVVLLMALAPPAATEGQRDATWKPGTRPLSERELRALLPGLYVAKIVPKEERDLSTPEMFNKDGTYISDVGGREIDGHYTVESGMVCVKDYLARKYCRFVLVDDENRYYFSKAIQPDELIPIRVSK
jgi:hypothetical protein